MARFFIERPIFAWVVAIFIIVIGLVSMTQLPVAQYPRVAPPTIQISAAYPGATAQMLEDAVLAIIEREMNGAKGLMYMETTSQANGTGTIKLSFETNVNPDMAQVDVQNRLSRATPRLPAVVTQQGVRVEQATTNFLMLVSMRTDNPGYSVEDLNDYAARNIVPEIQRIDGVGSVTQFGAERAMRIWVDPVKLKAYDLSMAAISGAISQQNAQVSAGSLGSLPNLPGQPIDATIVVDGQLNSVDAFKEIILRANTDGSTVRLKDVARIEMGTQGYNANAKANGLPAVGVGVQLSPTGNALATATAVRAKMENLSQFFPEGVQWSVPYDSSAFVSVSIEKVFHTLLEAIALVFVVMFIFLQNIRYTIIPTIVVPIALLGVFGVLLLLGMSINVLTMFGMVLVIGIVVDDAIVVVENVERIMSEERLTPLKAARKAMGQISGAIVGITVVLIAVFVPLAFFPGSTGNIYRQFAVTMVTSIAFSAFLALSLTPALCGTLLKPVEADHALHGKGFWGRFFGGFNRGFKSTARAYESSLAKMLRRTGRLAVLYIALGAVTAFVFMRLHSGFLPNEDQGFIITTVQLPSGATRERTREVLTQLEQTVARIDEVRDYVTVAGFSFTGQGQNMGLSFITLHDWSTRKSAAQSAQSVANRINGEMAKVRDAFVYAMSPPAIPELGTATGFTLRLQDRSGMGHQALVMARNQLLGMASQSPILLGVRPDGMEDAPQMRINIDREKAGALGVGFDSINAALTTAMGSAYINDFPNQGRMQRVIVQADAPARMTPEAILSLPVANAAGEIMPLSTFASTEWITGAMQTTRYNGYPAMNIAGDAAPGHSTGEAMNEMEKLVAQLPEGVGYEWTGQSREEKIAGGQAVYVYSFALLAILLALAALYESWSIPLAVLLVVPLGILGVVSATWLRGMDNDVYFQIGLVTIMGLSAKNAILIIEFAKDLHAQGKSVVAAALSAAHMRFRPILMTSLAFTLGVLPLFFANGASSASQRAIGTGVVGGMITGTVFAVLFVPAFFVVVRYFFKGSARQHEHDMKQVRKHEKESRDEDE